MRRRVGGRGERWRRDGAWIGDVCDSVADGAAYGSGSLRELERCTAAGAVHQHHHDGDGIGFGL